MWIFLSQWTARQGEWEKEYNSQPPNLAIVVDIQKFGIFLWFLEY